MEKIDKRRKYLLGVDTETCNGFMVNGQLDLTDSLVYDLGYAVTDKNGNIYRTRSFVIYEVYVCMREAMQSAYYANKIPIYEEDLKNGTRKLVRLENARRIMFQDMEEFGIDTVFAHNAGFDYRALNNTIRYITKSEKRYFFPYKTIMWDTLKMARDTICKQKMYGYFCQENGYMTKHATPQPRATAEILTRYLTCDNSFVESHTGLEDVLIEAQILAKCFKTHKKMRKELFAKA